MPIEVEEIAQRRLFWHTWMAPKRSYVERNPFRAGLIEQAQDWKWSSLRPNGDRSALDPAPRGADWKEFVNTPMTEAEVAEIRLSLRRDRPYGRGAWSTETAGLPGLEYSLRHRGRPLRTPARGSQ